VLLVVGFVATAGVEGVVDVLEGAGEVGAGAADVVDAVAGTGTVGAGAVLTGSTDDFAAVATFAKPSFIAVP